MSSIEIVRNSLRVYQESLAPAIFFKLRSTVQENSLPINIGGVVYCDGRLIAALVDLPSDQHTVSQESVVKHLTASRGANKTNEHSMIFLLDKKSLDYIEDKRDKNQGDINLKLSIILKILTPQVKIGDFRTHRLDLGTQTKEILVEDIGINSITGNPNTNILLGVNENKSATDKILRYDIIRSDIEVEISSSKWVNDFKTQLGLGSYLIVEIPQFILDMNKIPNSSLTQVEDRLKENLIAASEMIPKIEKEIKNSEWEHVVEKSRIVIEQIKKDVTQQIKDIIIARTGIEEKNVRQFTMALDNLQGYFNALHHPNKGFTGSKEDAYMCYMLVTSLINLLARKFMNYIDSKPKP